LRKGVCYPTWSNCGEDDDEWGFAVCGNKDVFLANLVYPDEKSAKAARQAVIPVLAEAAFIAAEES
jgi:hypothetical protein